MARYAETLPEPGHRQSGAHHPKHPFAAGRVSRPLRPVREFPPCPRSKPSPKPPPGTKATRPPDIVIGDSDFATLTALAESAGGPLADAADQLLTELDRARRVPDNALPHDRVRLYDWVEFQTGDGASRRVQLVRPEEADITEGRVSVLTPVGAALIGLAPAKPIAFVTPGGGRQTLTVLITTRGE